MLLTAGILLALVSAYFEITLVNHSPLLKKALLKHPAMPLIASVGLSILLGMAFGAVGVTVLIAGVTSTILTRPYYWWLMHGDQMKANVKEQKLRVYTRSKNAVPKAIVVPTSYIYRTLRKK